MAGNAARRLGTGVSFIRTATFFFFPVSNRLYGAGHRNQPVPPHRFGFEAPYSRNPRPHAIGADAILS